MSVEITEEEYRELQELEKQIQSVEEEIARVSRLLKALRERRIYLVGRRDMLITMLGRKYGFDPAGSFRARDLESGDGAKKYILEKVA